MITPDLLEAIRQEHEGFLSQLEALAVEAITINDWTKFYAYVVNFQNEFDLHSEFLIVLEQQEGV